MKMKSDKPKEVEKTEEELALLKEFFDQIDVDNSG